MMLNLDLANIQIRMPIDPTLNTSLCFELDTGRYRMPYNPMCV